MPLMLEDNLGPGTTGDIREMWEGMFPNHSFTPGVDFAESIQILDCITERKVAARVREADLVGNHDVAGHGILKKDLVDRF